MSAFRPDVPLGLPARRLLAALLLALVVLAVAWRHLSGGPPASPSLAVAPLHGVGGDRAGGARAAPAHPRLLVVDVAGAVRRPGLVRLRQGARVADAIARAAGFARNADRAGVNLAAPVADGQQVLVPARSPTGTGGVGAGAAGSALAGPVSLSSATAEQLDTLPGIGPVTAQKILDYRAQHGAFRSVDELDAIPGIGPARIAELQGLVVP